MATINDNHTSIRYIGKNWSRSGDVHISPNQNDHLWFIIDGTTLTITCPGGQVNGSSNVQVECNGKPIGTYSLATTDAVTFTHTFSDSSPKVITIRNLDPGKNLIFDTMDIGGQILDTIDASISIATVLKANLNDTVSKLKDLSKTRLYFTEDGGIYITKMDGTIRRCGIDDDTMDTINSILVAAPVTEEEFQEIMTEVLEALE